MPKIKCPKCSAEFEVEPNYNSFYCRQCHSLVKPSFRMDNGVLIFLNEKFEGSVITPDAQNTFEKTQEMFLKFARDYESEFVKKTLEETSRELAEEYTRTVGDENYIQQIIDSRRAIAKVAATIRN